MNKASVIIARVTIILINLQVILKENILIDKNTIIELIYDDELVLQANRLFDADAVADLDSLNGGLFLCKVKDGKVYEVEIQSPFTKKQKASCDCTFFTSHHICKHVIAGLMLIRSEKNKKQTIKEQKTAANNKPKISTLNISQILEEVSQDELISFVKSYAKRDTKFATQLKVNFARKIDTTDNAEKYKNILNSVIRPHTGDQTKASASEIKTALRVLEDFADQVNDCIALGQFREALNIYSAAFAKLEYLKHYYANYNENMTALSISYHKMIDYFLVEKLPPELRTDLIVFLTDLATRSYYHYSSISFNIIKLIKPYIKPSDNITLNVSLENLISLRPSKELAVLLALWLINNGKYSDSSWAFIKDHALLHIEIVDLLLSIDESQLALRVLESIHHPKKVNKDVVNRMVFLYVRFKKTTKLVETAGMAYLQSGDMKYIDILKRELNDDEYQNFILRIEEELTKSKSDPNLLIKIYRKEENWSGLILFLDKVGDLEILMQHDSILYKYEKNALAQLYIHIIRIFLDAHLGDSAFEYLTKLKTHWSINKMENTMLKVSQFISSEFEHRPKLMEAFK